jgi:hypothetical protein
MRVTADSASEVEAVVLLAASEFDRLVLIAMSATCPQLKREGISA